MSRMDKGWDSIRIFESLSIMAQEAVEDVSFLDTHKGTLLGDIAKEVLSDLVSDLYVINKSFQLRDCSLIEFKSRKTPCLLYQIKQCSAPCVSYISDEDYKKDLKSKYRVKVNKADSTSAMLEMKDFNEADFATYKDQLQALYENTIANADFNAQVLDLETYIKLRALYKKDFIVQAYFFENKLVAFLSALKTNDYLDAHFIGLDYGVSKQLAIYPRILNDYIRLGIKHQVKQINFGRTASEIKTTIGALPEPLMCYIRHKRSWVNKLISPFFKMVNLKDFKQHDVFKQKKRIHN